MALNQMQPMQRRKEGGGGIGKIVGTIGGGIIGGYLSGGSPQGVMAGAGLGGALGGTVGDKVVKPEAGSGPQFQPAGSAMERRAQAPPSQPPAYASQSPILEDSLKALNELPSEQQEQYRQPLLKAYALSLRNDYRNGGIA